jgi:phosphoribosylaminoimidazolecarboxamide formyltransferase/IMP cyclohydrolase
MKQPHFREEKMSVKIKRALISVSDKTGLDELAKFLKEQDIEILSTGGTANKLRDAGLNVKDVSQHTGFPEIMDGRVKTLHPSIHGGLLAVLDNDEHVKAMKDNDITPIDLVIVNLYPFEETVAKGAGFDEVIENIDIGGPSMVRSAAKNHAFTAIITDHTDYAELIKDMQENDGATSDAFRKKMAAKAFSRTAAYDCAISTWFANQQGENFPKTFNLTASLKQGLRYGENPHQSAAFYSYNDGTGISAATQLQGKELSYNNINDADAALQLVSEFAEPASVIIKHANPCGVAIGDDVLDAYNKALASDPVSAFGGILAFNRKLEANLAEEIAKMFVEAIIAPDISDEAKTILAKKKNVRILLTGENNKINNSLMVKSVVGGFLVQENDSEQTTQEELNVVTKRIPNDDEIKEMLFAFKVCKHVKSNAIVLTKNNASIGIGAGQMSRVDSSRIAALKAEDCKVDPERANGSVLASDAFFPFADGVEQAARAGVTAIIQPGGSIRDEEVIAEANKHNIAMVFTGKRHFRH